MTRWLRQFPITIILVITNVLVFCYLRYHIGTFQNPLWFQGLLFNGAEFAPLSLDNEWYRLFTHLFIHGHLAHLLFNTYALLVVGGELEQAVGKEKFLWIYFLSGFTASLASLYFNMFTIGFGASGAIFGLFGFSLVLQIKTSRVNGNSITPIIINFILFLGLNLLFAKALNSDNAAHLGGLLGGLLLGLVSLLEMPSRWLKVDYLFLCIFIAAFLLLPRYQVTYFQFFQQVLKLEAENSDLLRKNISDEQFLIEFKHSFDKWDSVHRLLRAHAYLPKALRSDTFRLSKYLALRKEEALYRAAMIEQETFRYLDSIEIAQSAMNKFLQLDYPLIMLRPVRPEKPDSLPPSKLVRAHVWYDEDWIELEQPPGEFYRLGQRDSLGQWQGRVVDFFNDGRVQMKGSYRDNLRSGVFLYYSDHNTYTSVGRCENGAPVGKWEYFHNNGKLKSEEYYNQGNFVKNWWDEFGNQLIRDGEGQWIEYHDNGKVAEEGSVKGGKREGRWYGLHDDGSMYFEEYYRIGRLIRGRSRTKDGQTFVYDASSEFPMPEGGNDVLVAHLNEEAQAMAPTEHGIVHLTFRVTVKQVLTDFIVDKKLSPKLDSAAIEMVKSGPRWLPARIHGCELIDGWGKVTVRF